MFRISKDSPAYYITSVTNERLPVFRKPEMKDLLSNSINEARTSASLLLFAYVIMTDHIHLLVGTERKPSDVLRFINGIASRRVIDFLKTNEYHQSLEKLRRDVEKDNYRYSLWDHHPNLKLITDEDVFMQKASYIHKNPIRLGLIDQPEDYRWSSYRCWQKTVWSDEPLMMDLGQIAWKSKW